MSKNTEHIQNILSNLSKDPGVYQMKDKEGIVMYVGKAKNLKNRVSSYFLKTNDLSVAKKQMVSKIADIEIIICKTEVEALVLETNLIKHLTPKYNILMKDDKNLAYLKITNSPVPEIIKTRQRIRDGATYFGPYVSGVEQSIRALRRIFRIRNCRVKFASRKSLGENHIEITDKSGKTLPCMDYYIGICPAPCLLESSKIDAHNHNISQLQDFLSGNTTTLFADLENEMKQKASKYEFEEAQKIKETIVALRGLHEKQSVRDFVDGDLDICIQYEKYEKSYIALTQVRSGQVIGVFRHEVKTGIDEGDDIMIGFLMRQYIDGDDLPKTLLLTQEISDDAFGEFLKSLSIQIEFPKIGPKKELLDFTRNQLKEYAYKKELSTLENKTLSRDHMVNVLEKIGYAVPKKGEIVFECYDISHTDGHFTYASRVVIVNGKPDTSRYKKYKIKTLEDGMIDDFASHREVMVRRTIEGIREKNFPHLIIIDGGKGQLSSALSGIREGIYIASQDQELKDIPQDSDIPLCSIAKREEEIFIPTTREPILFQHGTPELMVLQKARDESHRFSITANKSARSKAMKKNILEELPGIGPVTRKKLLKIAGSVDGLKDISLSEIESICTKTQIDVLRDHGIIG